MKFNFSSVSASLLVVLLFAESGWAASTKQEVIQLKEEVGELRAGQEAIQKELKEIKKLLEQGARAAAPTQPGFEPSEVTIGDAPYLGEPDATVTLMEFSDYQCPYCSRHYRDVLPTLVEEYVKSGQLKYVMRENPILSIHPRAMAASQSALCAQDQGKYWEMHNLIFDNQRALTDQDLKGHAATLGLSAAEFDECLDTKKYEKRVNDDLADGRSLGVRGTPAFVLGITDAKDSNKAYMTEFINGAQSLDNFKRVIDQLLEEANEG